MLITKQRRSPTMVRPNAMIANSSFADSKLTQSVIRLAANAPIHSERKAVHRVDLRAINVLGHPAFKRPSIDHEKSALVQRDGASSTEFLSRNAKQAVAMSPFPPTGFTVLRKTSGI